jgi:dolichol-phosphate mannosyltransferase
VSTHTNGTDPIPTATPSSNGRGPGDPLLSVIIPTYNERKNIAPLVESVLDVLGDTASEVLVVDDNSPDGTALVVERLAACDPRVRLVARAGKLGLASAVFAGAEAAKGEYICSMDADFSHDPEELSRMLKMACNGADVVIGSRFVPGSLFVGQPFARRLISGLFNGATRLALRLKPKDVLTGYVLCKRELITTMPTRYSARGFKFLMELLATRPGLSAAEWPIRFRERRHGRSKVGVREVKEFARLWGRLLWWQLGSARSNGHRPQ